MSRAAAANRRSKTPARASPQSRHSREGGNPVHGDVEDKKLGSLTTDVGTEGVQSERILLLLYWIDAGPG